MQFLTAFLVGGLICAVSQIILDTLKCTTVQLLVVLVGLGAILQGVGLYDSFQNFAGAGALVPVSGFGSSITKGMLSEVERFGWYGLFTGAFEITGLGLAAAIIFSSVAALFSKSRR